VHLNGVQGRAMTSGGSIFFGRHANLIGAQARDTIRHGGPASVTRAGDDRIAKPLYGTATYTCDSEPLAGADEAARLQLSMVHDIVTCLGENWAKAEDQSAAEYIVVRPAAGAASITLSIDQDDRDQYLVRLTLFLRAGARRE
jgi:hypothetical protein